MAGPHVVGVVALLWQAHPALSRDIDATEALLNGSANPNISVSNGSQCGGVGQRPEQPLRVRPRRCARRVQRRRRTSASTTATTSATSATSARRVG